MATIDALSRSWLIQERMMTSSLLQWNNDDVIVCSWPIPSAVGHSSAVSRAMTNNQLINIKLLAN